MDTHDAWVMDGNYTKLSFARRLEEADVIILLLFGRISCLYRVVKRYRKYRNTTRPDMTEGCHEKLDWEFVKWILYEGRTKRKRQTYRDVMRRYPEKVIVIRSQRQLDAVMRQGII